MLTIIIIFALVLCFIMNRVLSDDSVTLLYYYLVPKDDLIVIFHAAIGEEVIFRILPSVLIPEYWYIRLIISSIVFSTMHGIPYFTANVKIKTILKKLNATFFLGAFLFLLSGYMSTAMWYFVCCVIHIVNNVLVISSINSNIRYHQGVSNGFVTRLL